MSFWEVPSVRRLGDPPSALIKKISECPCRTESNAICLPSGDQRGVPVEGAASDVNCTGFEPSLLHTHNSEVPERLEPKAILLPSGEKLASNSMREDVMSFSGRPDFAVGPEARHIAILRRLSTKASCAPSRGIVGLDASSPAATTVVGTPPAIGILHKLCRPARLKEKLWTCCPASKRDPESTPCPR